MNSVLSPVLILAQMETTQETAPLWAQLVVGVLPWVIIFAVIWFVLWKIITRYQRPLQARSLEHMDRIEARTDVMIDLLKQINDKLDHPRP